MISGSAQTAFKELRQLRGQVERALATVPDEVRCPNLIYSKQFLEMRLAAFVVVEEALQRHCMRTCQAHLVPLMNQCEEAPRWDHVFKEDSYNKKLAAKVLLKSPMRDDLPHRASRLFELRESMLEVSSEWGLKLGEFADDLEAAEAVFEGASLTMAVTAALVILQEHDGDGAKEIAKQFLAAEMPQKFPACLKTALRSLSGTA